MELKNLLRSLRRRWIPGLVTFAVVTLAVFGLATWKGQAAPAIPNKASGTTALQVVNLAPTGADKAESADSVQAGTPIIGYLQDMLGSKAVKLDAIKRAGMEANTDVIVPLMTTSPTPWWGGQMIITGLAKEDIEKLMPAWVAAAADATAKAQTEATGQQYVRLTASTAPTYGFTPAAAPVVNPLKKIALPLAAILGLLAALVVVFLLDSFDRRLGGRRLALSHPGVRELPRLGTGGTGTAPDGDDGIRRLRASVLALGGGRTLLVTPRSAEKSSQVARRLAESLAAAGHRTLLVDAAATKAVSAAPSPQHENLDVLTVGAEPDLADSVAGPTFAHRLSEAMAAHDQTVVAGGSLLEGPVATTLASLVPHAIVVAPESTRDADLEASLGRLAEVRAEVLGVSVDDGR